MNIDYEAIVREHAGEIKYCPREGGDPIFIAPRSLVENYGIRIGDEKLKEVLLRLHKEKKLFAELNRKAALNAHNEVPNTILQPR